MQSRKKKESETNLITRWKLKAAAGDNIDLTDIGKVRKKTFAFPFWLNSTYIHRRRFENEEEMRIYRLGTIAKFTRLYLAISAWCVRMSTSIEEVALRTAAII